MRQALVEMEDRLSEMNSKFALLESIQNERKIPLESSKAKDTIASQTTWRSDKLKEQGCQVRPKQRNVALQVYRETEQDLQKKFVKSAAEDDISIVS